MCLWSCLRTAPALTHVVHAYIQPTAAEETALWAGLICWTSAVNGSICVHCCACLCSIKWKVQAGGGGDGWGGEGGRGSSRGCCRYRGYVFSHLCRQRRGDGGSGPLSEVISGWYSGGRYKCHTHGHAVASAGKISTPRPGGVRRRGVYTWPTTSAVK